MRTTLDIGRSMGAVVTELLADALARRRSSRDPSFRWTSRAMKSRVDLTDKEAVRAALGGRQT